MTIDLEKLTPEPWFADYQPVGPCGARCYRDQIINSDGMVVAQRPNAAYRGPGKENREKEVTDAHFIAVARAAFGVMMRRGWFVSRGPDGKWYARAAELPTISELAFNDPYSALVGAEKWYVANVGGKPS